MLSVCVVVSVCVCGCGCVCVRAHVYGASGRLSGVCEDGERATALLLTVGGAERRG